VSTLIGLRGQKQPMTDVIANEEICVSPTVVSADAMRSTFTASHEIARSGPAVVAACHVISCA
jgi:hypothetical protein